MKKVFALVLCLALGLAMLPTTISLAHPAEEDFVEISDALVASFEYTASKWYSSENNRALLTIAALADVMIADKEAIDLVQVDLSKTSYVLRSSSVLSIFIQGKEKSLVIIFNAPSGELSYRIEDYASDLIVEMMLDGLVEEAGGSYKENDKYALLDVLEVFKEALSS